MRKHGSNGAPVRHDNRFEFQIVAEILNARAIEGFMNIFHWPFIGWDTPMPQQMIFIWITHFSIKQTLSYTHTWHTHSIRWWVIVRLFPKPMPKTCTHNEQSLCSATIPWWYIFVVLWFIIQMAQPILGWIFFSIRIFLGIYQSRYV